MKTSRTVLLLVIWVLLAVGVAGAFGLRKERHRTVPVFDAHEFAVFHSDYGALRTQSASLRADHFRKLVDVAESAEITPGMAQNLVGFCRSVLDSEEALEVKAQARMALNSLEKRLGQGTDGSVARAGR